MSYRDPKIIVDRSAEIYAQGANQLGQTMGKFVEDSAKTKLEETGLRIKQINAIGQWGQLERDKAEATVADNASKVSPGLADQYIEMQTKRYNDLISRSVASKINGGTTSPEERDWIQKESISLKMAGATVEQFRAAYELNKQEVEENVSDGIINNPDAVWNSLEDKLSFNSLGGIEVPGVVSEKTLNPGESGGKFSYNIKSTIDSKTELGKSIIDAWGLPVDKKTGLATINQENLDFANLKPPITHITPALELEKLDVPNVLKNGVVGDLAFIQQQEYTTESADGKTVTTSSGIFDEVAFKKHLKGTLDAEATSVIQSNIPKGQTTYIDSRFPLPDGALMTQERWDKDYPDVEDRIEYISDQMFSKALNLAKNQLRSRKATPEDVEKGYATAEGLDVFYDPTVAKVVDTNKGGSTETSNKEGIMSSDEIMQSLYSDEGEALFNNMTLGGKEVVGNVSLPGVESNILSMTVNSKTLFEKYKDGAGDLQFHIRNGEKVPKREIIDFNLDTVDGIRSLVTAMVAGKKTGQTAKQREALTKSLTAKIKTYRKGVKKTQIQETKKKELAGSSALPASEGGVDIEAQLQFSDFGTETEKEGVKKGNRKYDKK